MNNLLSYSLSLLSEDEELRAKCDFKTHQFIMQKAHEYIGRDFFDRQLEVLDLGCGKRYPQSYLFALDGHTVTGLDLGYVVPSASLRGYYRSYKVNGFLDTARCIQLDFMGKRRKFRKQLKTLYKGEGFKGNNTPITFLQGNAETLEGLPNSYFDLVLSKDLFEHLKDPEACVKRIKEVIKPGGWCIHNIPYYSGITGGHNPRWDKFDEFEPWDHLRKEKFVLPAFINKWFINKFISLFKKHFSTVFFESFNFVDFNVSHLLTDAVWSEVSNNYPEISKDELLHDKLIVLAKNGN